MPTGYTAGVADGKITDFTEYALQCARNFGACIMLRDEPLSSEIPEFEPSDYHFRALTEASQELANFLAMDESQRRELHAAEHAKNVEEAERGIADKKQQQKRYEAMLEKAQAFKAPTPDHEAYAEFLVSQLEESIDWDCGTGFYEALKQPVDFKEWQTDKVARLRRDISYHRKEHEVEVERTESRNRWVRQLKEALGLT